MEQNLGRLPTQWQLKMENIYFDLLKAETELKGLHICNDKLEIATGLLKESFQHYAEFYAEENESHVDIVSDRGFPPF